MDFFCIWKNPFDTIDTICYKILKKNAYGIRGNKLK